MTHRSLPEDARVLEFACRWVPYGGGDPGDILVEFGISPARYVARLARTLDGPLARTLTPEMRASLREFVAARSAPYHAATALERLQRT
jgi:hypothetical protein